MEPLGIEFTHLPPAPDLSYHVMGADSKRHGILLVSEAGRGLPFLGIWVEDRGGMWQAPEAMQRMRASAPIPIPSDAVFTELSFQPSVVLVPLAGAQVGHQVRFMRKHRATVFFVLEDWLEGVVEPNETTSGPSSSTVLVAVGEDGSISALLIPRWWGESFAVDWEAAVRGGQSVTPWEEKNELWEIRRPGELHKAVKSLEEKAGDSNILPPESGEIEALRELDKFLHFGDSRRARFFYAYV